MKNQEIAMEVSGINWEKLVRANKLATKRQKKQAKQW